MIETELPRELALLLDRARSERKRRGHDTTVPAHLALALCLRHADVVASRFPDARGVVDAHIESVDPRGSGGDSAEVDMLLSEAAVAQDPIDGLLALLAPVFSDESGEHAGVSTSGSANDPRPTPNAVDTLREAEPAAPPGPGLPHVLNGLAVVVSPEEGIVGRDDTVDELIALLGRRDPATPLVVGRRGMGRTATLRALASRLNADGYDGPLAGKRVLRILPDAVVSQRRSLTMRGIIDAIDDLLSGDPPVVCVDDLHVVAALTGDAPDRDMLGVIGSLLENRRFPLVLTIDKGYLARLAMHDRRFEADTSVVELGELSKGQLLTIAERRAAALAGYHDVEVPAGAIELALGDVQPSSTLFHPGALVERLDDACARAALRKAEQVEASDFTWLAAEQEQGPIDRSDLEAALLARIHGQDRAVRSVTNRVVLTRAKLDLHPNRPDGVFLFVGPTGVGKTALATALAAEIFDDPEALIRLDMSEYSHDWAVSRLIGPQPGYVGYSEPEGWLTTRVRERSRAVLLLDEIEKSHPAVWNTFLQVFDAGRLTDSRGRVADFSEIIVIMTSNAGSDAFTHFAVGFGGADLADGATARINSRIRDLFPPELFNRIDEVVVFHPLTPETIRDIAESLVHETVDRLGARGYEIQIPADVIDLIATEGYDRSLGARHLHRNVERTLLESIVAHQPGSYAATVDGGRVIWSTVGDAAQ